MKSIFAFVALTLGFAFSAQAIEAVSSQLVRHRSNQYWVINGTQADPTQSFLIGATEAVVDQLEAMDIKSSPTCKIKARRVPMYNPAGLHALMVYDISDCKN